MKKILEYLFAFFCEAGEIGRLLGICWILFSASFEEAFSISCSTLETF